MFLLHIPDDLSRILFAEWLIIKDLMTLDESIVQIDHAIALRRLFPEMNLFNVCQYNDKKIYRWIYKRNFKLTGIVLEDFCFDESGFLAIPIETQSITDIEIVLYEKQEVSKCCGAIDTLLRFCPLLKRLSIGSVAPLSVVSKRAFTGLEDLHLQFDGSQSVGKFDSKTVMNWLIKYCGNLKLVFVSHPDMVDLDLIATLLESKPHLVDMNLEFGLTTVVYCKMGLNYCVELAEDHNHPWDEQKLSVLLKKFSNITEFRCGVSPNTFDSIVLDWLLQSQTTLTSLCFHYFLKEVVAIKLLTTFLNVKSLRSVTLKSCVDIIVKHGRHLQCIRTYGFKSNEEILTIIRACPHLVSLTAICAEDFDIDVESLNSTGKHIPSLKIIGCGSKFTYRSYFGAAWIV